MKKFIFTIKPIRNAFTMQELVFVIVVLGILAALAMPRLEQDRSQEAADHILSNIRYTQHLALNDDKHMQDNPNWQQRFWKIQFGNCNDGTDYFRIGSDDNMDGNGNFELEESATDPYSGKALYANNGSCDSINISENVLIGRKYGVTLTSRTGGCGTNVGSYIGFDHLGRPHTGFGNSNTPNNATYMTQRCTLTFNVDGESQFVIYIEPETGYAWINGQPNS